MGPIRACMTPLILTTNEVEDKLAAEVGRSTRFQGGYQLVASLEQVPPQLIICTVDRGDEVGVERREVGADGRRFSCVGAFGIASLVIFGATGSRFKVDGTAGGDDGERNSSNECREERQHVCEDFNSRGSRKGMDAARRGQQGL